MHYIHSTKYPDFSQLVRISTFNYMNITQTGFLIGCALLVIGSATAWYRSQMIWAISLLIGAAFLLRLLMSSIDPFLHDWDERFHAVVAKNMITNPFKPMLHADVVLPYDYKSWCCNHIWLHKQPLFLWQMALSMNVFGVNELAMRLPSALLGSLAIYPIYRLGCLIFNQDTGYLAALLATFAFYQLEQTSGAIGMDHNDVAFAAYVTASIWAYYEYRVSSHPWRWLLLVGVFVGAAVLCKWLVGLVVYTGWGIDILLRNPRRWSEYGRLTASVAIAFLLFMPWQLYTAWRFPLESAYERTYNARHFSEVLEGQIHDLYYYFEMLPTHYGGLAWLIPIGIITALYSFFRKPIAPLFSIIIIIYGFFTVAATKMYSYTYVISALLLLLIAVPLATGMHWLRTHTGRLAPLIVTICLLTLLLIDAHPWSIYNYRIKDEPYSTISTAPLGWKVRVINAELYRALDNMVPEGYIVFNILGSDELAGMFYSNRTTLPWWPSEKELSDLLAKGRHIAIFPNHHDQQAPDYLRKAPGVITIWGIPQ
jgi:4-amino-4-deoxy-L-arabinose transferase-like glycosyltransferase